MDPVRQIAQAVLYEGYLLWPYRRSALKNRRRWMFGCVYPRAYCRGGDDGDRWSTQAEFLIETDGDPATATVSVEARFLHVVRRDIVRCGPHGQERVDELTVGGQRYLAWEEATERAVSTRRHDSAGIDPSTLDPAGLDSAALDPAGIDPAGIDPATLGPIAPDVMAPYRTGIDPAALDPMALDLAALDLAALDLATLGRAAAESAVGVPTGHDTEWLTDPADPTEHRAGAVVRSWRALRGAMTIRARHAGDGVHVLTVELRNTTPGTYRSRQDAFAAAFVSAHLVVRVAGGRLVSLTDPPSRLRPLADECRNTGLWPVLVGLDGARDTALASPIILPDYPQIAPESPGDFFDATEIDQLLMLNVLALTDEERREMRDTDPRAAAILDRVEAMSPGDLMRLHGAIREPRPLGG